MSEANKHGMVNRFFFFNVTWSSLLSECDDFGVVFKYVFWYLVAQN